MIIPITAGIRGIWKNLFVIPLMEPSAVRVCCTDLPAYFFWFFCGSLQWLFTVGSPVLFMNPDFVLYDFVSIITGIGTGSYMGSIYKKTFRVQKTILRNFSKDSGKNLFKQVSILKTPGVIFTKNGEMGNLFMHSIAQIPAVSKVYLDFPYRFSHGRGSENVLDYGNPNLLSFVVHFTPTIYTTSLHWAY